MFHTFIGCIRRKSIFVCKHCGKSYALEVHLKKDHFCMRTFPIHHQISNQALDLQFFTRFSLLYCPPQECNHHNHKCDCYGSFKCNEKLAHSIVRFMSTISSSVRYEALAVPIHSATSLNCISRQLAIGNFMLHFCRTAFLLLCTSKCSNVDESYFMMIVRIRQSCDLVLWKSSKSRLKVSLSFLVQIKVYTTYNKMNSFAHIDRYISSRGVSATSGGRNTSSTKKLFTASPRRATSRFKRIFAFTRERRSEVCIRASRELYYKMISECLDLARHVSPFCLSPSLT